MDFNPHFEKIIRELEAASQHRSLKPRSGVDFSSNDYLGFSEDKILRQRILARLENLPTGSTGSRLLRGENEVYSQAEATLARFSAREAAIIFPSGYQANLGLLSGLVGPNDVVFSDQFNHASIIDGIRLSRAQKKVYPHCDLGQLEELLRTTSSNGLKLIVTESIFSMDGDRAPLSDLADLAEKYEAGLVVDEAHATGLYGSGLVQELLLTDRVLATQHTGGKALGVGGAWIACSAALKDYLVNFSRPLIFSTAPIPALAVSLEESVLHLSSAGPEQIEALWRHCSLLSASLNLRQIRGPIFPYILGDNASALRMSQKLIAAGLDVRAIRPPTVPEGTARLRMTIHADQDPKDIQKLTRILQESMS
ncbi:8-amino-7-oxononanoate synthase [bacterium]|nr:8-amino-7-oxononanoate synthase [bacterium]